MLKLLRSAFAEQPEEALKYSQSVGGAMQAEAPPTSSFIYNPEPAGAEHYCSTYHSYTIYHNKQHFYSVRSLI